MQEERRNLENCQCKGRKEKEIYEKAVKTLMFTDGGGGQPLPRRHEHGEGSSPRAEDRQGSQH